jgi:hypothetical protein
MYVIEMLLYKYLWGYMIWYQHGDKFEKFSGVDSRIHL